MGTQDNFNSIRSSLTDVDKDQILDLIGKGTRAKTKDRLRSILRYHCESLPHHGIFGRLYKDKNGWSYCAGQSYTDEIRCVRECILGKV